MRGDGIIPVMEVGNNNSVFGVCGNGDWAWIIILFLIFGNGRGFGNGFGGFGGNGGYSGVADNYVLATDFATLERKLDAVNTYIPNKENKEVYDRNFEVFKKLYKSNKENFKELNELK